MRLRHAAWIGTILGLFLGMLTEIGLLYFSIVPDDITPFGPFFTTGMIATFGINAAAETPR